MREYFQSVDASRKFGVLYAGRMTVSLGPDSTSFDASTDAHAQVGNVATFCGVGSESTTNIHLFNY
jgi:hypothetical protein